MITKYDLRRYRSIKAETKQLEEQIEELELIMVAPRIPNLTGLPGSHGECDKIGNIVAKAASLKESYLVKMDKLLDMQAEIEAAISVLDEKERRLIRLYYFSGLTWEEVACQMDYSWNGIHKIHRKCLKKLGE